MSAEVTSRPRRVFHHSAGAVVFDGTEVLLVRRRREWAFPKGHIERDETAEDAACREVREETGIDIHVDSPLGPTEFTFKSHDGVRNRKLVDWFVAYRDGGEIRHERIFDEVRFVPAEEALRILTHDADRDLLERALSRLEALAAGRGTAAPRDAR